MKRLKNILLSMNNDTNTYYEMYNGKIHIIDEWYESDDYDTNFYRDNISYFITETNKISLDKPTITISIPCNLLFANGAGEKMKRLKYLLLQMENSTSNYQEMYEGKMDINFPSTSWNGHSIEPETHYDATYWYNDISLTISETNKNEKDKPTLTYNIPTDMIGINNYTETAADFCLREFKKYIEPLNNELYNKSRPDNENGKYYLHSPTNEVLKRNTSFFKMCPQRDYEYLSGTSVKIINDGIKRAPIMCLCIRLQVQLPKRKIRKTIQMLCRDLPDAVERFVYEFDVFRLEEALKLAQKQNEIRQWLKDSDYCAFIANGSILPREKNTNKPMKNAIPFISPPKDEIEIYGIKGMGVKKGVTVITGGGYSGKSTLLEAISSGIYNHILGDGRELCITDETAVSIAAEDGRSIKNVNISPFIKWLPSGDTSSFSTENASGSTSQAANIMEAINNGSKLLLIDEDRSATNFMIRDKLMKQLIKKEPITPFTDRVNELYNNENVSTILVIGGSGEYLSVADRIYLMDDYKIHDVTVQSKNLCDQSNVNKNETTDKACWKQFRTLYSDGFTSYPENSGSERLIVSDMGFIIIGDEKIDIRGLKNIASTHQLDALGFMLRHLEISNIDNKIDIDKKIDELYGKIDNEGLDTIYSAFFTTCNRFLDLPRKQELKAVINRMRFIKYC